MRKFALAARILTIAIPVISVLAIIVCSAGNNMAVGQISPGSDRALDLDASRPIEARVNDLCRG